MLLAFISKIIDTIKHSSGYPGMRKTWCTLYTLYNCILYLQVSFNTVNYMDSMNHNIHKISCTERGHILASNDTCNPVNVGYSQFWPPSKQTVCRISRILQHWCSTRGKILEYRIRVKIKISIHEFVLSFNIVKY